MTSSIPRRIAVIGAGIVGVCAALRLRQDGCDVLLIDRLGPGQATSGGNGGVLASSSVVPVTLPGLPRKAPGMAFDPESPLFVRWRRLPGMASWLARYLLHCGPEEARRISQGLAALVSGSLEEHESLAQGTAAASYIRPSDYVFVYANRAEFENEAFAWELRQAAGVRWTEIEGPELTAYDPVISGAYRFAIVMDGHGIISDPGAYVAALAEHFARIGGRILRAEILDFIFEDGKLHALATRTGTIEADYAIVAAGVWSKELAAKLGASFPLESERGYHVEFETHGPVPRAPTMLAGSKFVATPMEGRLRCAGLVEFAGLDSEPNEEAFAYIEQRALAAFPSARLKAIGRWMGHRPATTDSLPIIGSLRDRPDVIFACGHHHVGLTAGPRTGRMAADLVAGRSANVDLTAYGPDRF